MDRFAPQDEVKDLCDVDDLLDFAEDVLQAPLHKWQRDMLTCWAKGQIYISSRVIGKQIMESVYQEWQKTRRDEIEPITSYDVQYTYEQLMAGELV